MNFIETYALKKILDKALKEGNILFGKENFQIILSSQQTEDKIRFHLSKIVNWSNEISFRDLEEAKSTSQTYVDLDFYLTPKKLLYSGNSPQKVHSIKKIFSVTDKHIVLLGQPGAGKTTSMKYLANLIFHDEGFLSETIKYPFLIRLREYRTESKISIISILYDIVGISLIAEKKVKKKGEKEYEVRKYQIPTDSNQSNKELVTFFLSSILDELGILIIIDGLDEIPVGLRDNVIQDISSLSLSLKKSRIILTSRVGDYNYQINNTKEFEICPLGDNQIESFTKKWLQDKPNKELLGQLKGSPFYDATIRPLTLSHLCAIYDREGTIPRKPKTVYRKIVNLLLEEWDLQKSIIRTSNYSNFETDRKFEFLTNLAYFLSINKNKSIFTTEDFKEVYLNICENYGLPKFESKKVAEELETHNGLFIQSGYEMYEFAHLSMQEYLTAEYIVRLPSIPFNRLLLSHPNEIAISTAISSNSTFYFSSLCLNFFNSFQIPEDFSGALINRLILEKVDFNYHPILGVAFLFFLTKSVKDTKSVKELRFFDNLYNLDSIKISIHKLNNYYEVVEEQENILTNGEASTIDLIAIENKTFFENEISSNLPKKLLAKKSYLINWG
ncbi:MAG: NACHT domain-containing protein [Saprospiraceae bacterium]